MLWSGKDEEAWQEVQTQDRAAALPRERQATVPPLTGSPISLAEKKRVFLLLLSSVIELEGLTIASQYASLAHLHTYLYVTTYETDLYAVYTMVRTSGLLLTSRSIQILYIRKMSEQRTDTGW